MRRATGAALAASALVALTVAGAATSGSSPMKAGGTISVSVDTPAADGTTVKSGPTLSGTASVAGPASPNTALIYVLDLSGSTNEKSVGTRGCGNQNHLFDALSDTTLDCELGAAMQANAAAQAAGTVKVVSVIGFGGTSTNGGRGSAADAKAIWLDPQGINSEAGTWTAPGATVPAASTWPAGNAVAVALSGAIDGQDYQRGATNLPTSSPFGYYNGFYWYSPIDFDTATNYWAAAKALAAQANDAMANRGVQIVHVIFLSDGDSTVGGPNGETAVQALLSAWGMNAPQWLSIDTFAFGTGASCFGTSTPNYGNLQSLAAYSYYGTCTAVATPSQVADVVRHAAALSIDRIQGYLQGEGPVPITTTTALPANGPTTVTWKASLPNLKSGTHTLCVDAIGSDIFGGVSAQDCRTFTVQPAPVVTASVAPSPVDEGSPTTLTGTTTGGTATWLPTPGCTLADATAATTDVTCVDNGTYTFTYRADDGLNDPVTATTTLTVNNVPPTAALTLDQSLVGVGSTVGADVAITDPGRLDTHTCSFSWGDGTPDSTSPEPCHATHQYGAPGTYTVTATATDKDGGTGTASQQLTVKAPPTVTLGGPLTAAEGSAIPVSGTVDGATSQTWSATGSTGTCTPAAAGALTTTFTCDDNGVYTLTLTATDQFGQTGSATETLTVTNVPPKLTIVSPPQSTSGRNVSFTGLVTDAGAHDTETCTVAWGDGATDTIPVTNGFCSASHSYADGLAGATLSAFATDDDGGASATRTLPLVFNRPPVCSAVAPTPSSIWPANNKLVLVTLHGATDPDNDPITYRIDGVTQDEPGVDWQPAAGGSVYVRATRLGSGHGRVYTIAYTVSDPYRATCAATVKVTVPHDQR